MENTENKIPNSENQDTQNSSFFSESISSSNGLEPSLRFGHFVGNWKKSKLSSLFKKCLEKNENGLVDNVICNSAKNGLMPQRDFFDKDIANTENTNGYYIIQENDFVYNPRKSNEAPYGPISMYKYKDKGIVSPLYLCFRATKEIHPRYFEMYFKSSVWHKYIYFAGDSGARYDRVSIKDDVFFEMPINIPSLPEQQKIADFLSLIDQRIEKQRKLVENLKKYKRGLLSAIFDRKLRFKDTDFSLWKNVRLSECCLGFDNKRQPISSELREKGTVPYYGANGIQDYVKDYIFDGEYILLAEDGGHFDEFQTKPIAQYITGKSWVNNHAHILQATEKDCTKYIYYALVHKDIRKYINGSSRAKLNQEDMWQIVILLPNLKQQIKIAQFMSSIDKILSIEEKMLTVLEEKKQGLLQQMFI